MGASSSNQFFRYCSFQEAANRIGRAFYPWSWNETIFGFFNCKIDGYPFGIKGDVQGVKYIDPDHSLFGEWIRKGEESGINDVLKVVQDVWNAKPSKDTKEKKRKVTFEIQYIKSCDQFSDILPMVESRGVVETFDLDDPLQRHYLKNLLLFSNVLRLLNLAIWGEKYVRICGLDSNNIIKVPDEEEAREIDQSHFENNDELIWNMLVLKSSYIYNITEKNGEQRIIVETVGLNQLDLQNFINLYLYRPGLHGLSIEEIFASFDGVAAASFGQSSSITTLLNNIKKMPSVDKPPLTQVLEQVYGDYTTFSLELSKVEILYAKAKTELPPTEIARLSKKDLVTRVTKFVENLGFKVMEQHSVKEALEKDPKLDREKILLKNDPEAIATLLFNPTRKMGGPIPTPSTENERLRKKASKKKHSS